MKKIFLFLSFVLVLNSCKQKETTPPNSRKNEIQPLAAKPNCDLFTVLDTMTTEHRVDWLRTNQANAILPQFDICRETAHAISLQDYNAAVLEFWGGKVPEYATYNLDSIKSLARSTGYEDFIITSLDGDTIILSAGNIFTTNPVCFSFPLFYSIERLYTLDGKAKFLFTRGIIEGSETVVFHIEGTAHFYDMGQNPL